MLSNSTVADGIQIGSRNMTKTKKTNEDFLKEKAGVEGVDYYIDDRYWCQSCGSHTHRCDTSNGLCYECGADNWEPEPDKMNEIY